MFCTMTMNLRVQEEGLVVGKFKILRGKQIGAAEFEDLDQESFTWFVWDVFRCVIFIHLKLWWVASAWLT